MYCILSLVHSNWNKMAKKDKTLPEQLSQLERIVLLEHVHCIWFTDTNDHKLHCTFTRKETLHLFVISYIIKITIHCIVGIVPLSLQETNKNHQGFVMCSPHLSYTATMDDTNNTHQKISRPQWMVFLVDRRLHIGGYAIKQLFDILTKM